MKDKIKLFRGMWAYQYDYLENDFTDEQIEGFISSHPSILKAVEYAVDVVLTKYRKS